MLTLTSVSKPCNQWFSGMLKVLALAALLPSCVLMPTTQAKMRAQVAAEFHPQTAYQILVQFNSAVLDQFINGGMDPEHLSIIVHWVAMNDSILTGSQPELFEAKARETWPVVRSICGPYDSLQPFVSKLDFLLQ